MKKKLMNLHFSRQPILDRQQNLYAYELLFRSPNETSFGAIDGTIATSKIVSTSQFEHSLSDLAGGKPAHINFNLQSILNKSPTMIPAEQLVIEVIDIDKPGKRLLEECKALKEAGYKILLDNYVHQKAWLHFLPFIDMIKLDIRVACSSSIRLVTKIKEKYNHIKLICSKIETQDEFQRANDAGFDFFQGYFFAQPQEITKRSVDVNDFSLAEILFEISNSDFDLQKIIDVFQNDLNLTYKLLRYSNSAIFSRAVEVSSIKQAVVSLGKKELTKFITILFASQSIGNKPSELLSMSLSRAKFCENLAASLTTGLNPSVAFLTGMFSLIDMMLDEPMQELVVKLKLSADISAALLHKQGELALLIEMSSSYEKGSWYNIAAIGSRLSLTPEDIAKSYQQALNWSDEQMNIIG